MSWQKLAVSSMKQNGELYKRLAEAEFEKVTIALKLGREEEAHKKAKAQLEELRTAPPRTVPNQGELALVLSKHFGDREADELDQALHDLVRLAAIGERTQNSFNLAFPPCALDRPPVQVGQILQELIDVSRPPQEEPFRLAMSVPAAPPAIAKPETPPAIAPTPPPAPPRELSVAEQAREANKVSKPRPTFVDHDNRVGQPGPKPGTIWFRCTSCDQVRYQKETFRSAVCYYCQPPHGYGAEG